MSEISKKYLDFLAYKETGKIKYVDVTSELHAEKETSAELEEDLLEKMATVMGLSTDELFLEIGFVLERGDSPRDLGLEMLVTELSGRLALMESICLYATQVGEF